MYRDRLAERKLSVMMAAAERYEAKAPEAAEAARRLASGGPEMASSASRLAAYRRRESLKTYVRFEVRIGDTFDWVDVPPNIEVREAGRPVARIVELFNSRRAGEGFATGFVVAPGLLVTNWHVFATPEDATACGAHFGFEKDDSGILQGGTVFEVDPGRFFVSDEELDVAVVGLSASPSIGAERLTDFGVVPLIPSVGKILVGQSVNIVQHPDGRHKHWALQQNRLYVEPSENDLFLMYTADTLAGSSGSPAFNKDWELVGVHHGGVPLVQDGNVMTKTGEVWTNGSPETDIQWIANEGVRLSKIYAYLQRTQLPDPAHQELLRTLLDSATTLGTGRAVPPGREPAFESTASGARGMDDVPMQVTVNGTANFYVSGRPDAMIPEVEAPVAEIRTERKLRFDPDYAARAGYVPDFLLGYTVPLPTAPSDDVLATDGRPLVLDYHHFSLVMSKSRQLALWTAANVDYTPSKRRFTRAQLGGDAWKADPRIPGTAQVEDTEFYFPAKKFDRGHLVRRDDGAWGDSAEEEEFANADTFHWTNCTPQHEGFNRDMHQYQGIWGALEHHIAEQATFVGDRLMVFAGPVLNPDDPTHDFGATFQIQVPIAFWKIVIVAEDEPARLRAYAFVLDQQKAIEEFGWESRFRAGRFSELQVSLRDVTERTRVEFDRSLHEADPLAGRATESRAHRLTSLDSIVFD